MFETPGANNITTVGVVMMVNYHFLLGHLINEGWLGGSVVVGVNPAGPLRNGQVFRAHLTY